MPITDDSIGGASYRAPSIETVPYSGANYKSLPGAISVTSNGKNQYMGHIIGDRKLEPGETIQREYTLPLESAAATKADKK